MRSVLVILSILLLGLGEETVLAAPSEIPPGQDVGARERDFELQKRQETIKRQLRQRKKKARIKPKETNERTTPIL